MCVCVYDYSVAVKVMTFLFLSITLLCQYFHGMKILFLEQFQAISSDFKDIERLRSYHLSFVMKSSVRVG